MRPRSVRDRLMATWPRPKTIRQAKTWGNTNKFQDCKSSAKDDADTTRKKPAIKPAGASVSRRSAVLRAVWPFSSRTVTSNNAAARVAVQKARKSDSAFTDTSHSAAAASAVGKVRPTARWRTAEPCEGRRANHAASNDQPAITGNNM